MLKTVRQSLFFARVGAKDSAARRRTVMRCNGNGSSDLRHLSVAVIGAGAAGLVAARELKREGHRVTVFEQGDQVGGVWVYTDAVEAEDLLGLRGQRQRVHGSLYESLRTNLPRHVMAYTDFPFDLHATGSDDNRLFCGHEEVLRYLQKFDQAFGISPMVQFNTRVVEATPLQLSSGPHESSLGPQWRLKLEPANAVQSSTEHQEASTSERDFDALVVCNGHYSEPRVPNIPGRDVFPGRLLHTHNFRESSSFAGQTVVVMGASASGQDIAREIAAVADKVYFSARPMTFGSKVLAWEVSDEPFGPNANMVRRAAIESLGQDSSVTFQDGLMAENVDAVVFATGYQFAFPFLDKSKAINVQDNRVSPLYKHVVCTTHATLSFIGLPWQVIPFPLMELQSKWVARCLSGKSRLPAREEMEHDTAEFYSQREAEGVPVRYSHRLGEQQWDYNAWLGEQIGPDQAPLPDWRRQMHKAGQQNIRERPDSYRDTYPAVDLVEVAERKAQELKQADAVLAA